MHTCHRCDMDFATPRGLATHQKRTHVVSDDWVNDFLNLNNTQQGIVLADSGCEFKEIVIGPLDDDHVTHFKTALTNVVGVQYRYVIQELP